MNKRGSQFAINTTDEGSEQRKVNLIGGDTLKINKNYFFLNNLLKYFENISTFNYNFIFFKLCVFCSLESKSTYSPFCVFKFF